MNTIEPSLWQNPPAELRPAPLWTWNDKLEPDELRRQVRLFAEHGHGGFFMDARFDELSRRLLEIQRDFDYADELLMEKHARVEAGQFRIGRAAYDAVVIPSADTWSENTLALLQQFVAQDGHVIAIEPVATRVHGAPRTALAEFFQHPSVTRLAKPTAARLDKALAAIPRDIRVTTADGKLVKTMVHLHRTCGWPKSTGTTASPGWIPATLMPAICSSRSASADRPRSAAPNALPD